jgi:hypothetical protein
MPSSNPTTGIGVAAYVHVAGVNVTNPAGGSLVHPGSTASPINGQGIGATAGPSSGPGNFPVAQYALTLSLTGATVNGVKYNTTAELTAALVDVLNEPITNGGYNQTEAVWEAYCAPAPNTEGWYRPNNGSSTGSATSNYDACVITLGAPYGTYDADVVVTANHVGQCILECQFPTFDNTLGDNDGYTAPEEGPIMFIYAQVVVSVIA